MFQAVFTELITRAGKLNIAAKDDALVQGLKAKGILTEDLKWQYLSWNPEAKAWQHIQMSHGSWFRITICSTDRLCSDIDQSKGHHHRRPFRRCSDCRHRFRCLKHPNNSSVPFALNLYVERHFWVTYVESIRLSTMVLFRSSPNMIYCLEISYAIIASTRSL